jgi:hypothetical protein
MGTDPRDACQGSAKWLKESAESVDLMKSLKSQDSQGCFMDNDEFSQLIESILGSPTDADRRSIILKILERGLTFEASISEFSLVRRCFLTERKYLGLGAKSLEPGDEIWIIPRTQAPMILRRLSNGHHIVIGQAYVHGIMYGEADFESFGSFEDIILD